ncbi:serine/threonine kinase [Streptomyces phage Beuffert]|nr:serine/threonine kinase [Streptomyces phage Beuffert]
MQQLQTTSAVKIGNEEDAQTVAEWDWSNNEFPEGWFYEGEGVQRLVLLSPDGVIYKKEKPGEHDSNVEEYINYLRISNIPIKNWRVPRTSLYTIGYERIIAMEYVDGRFDTECRRYGVGYNAECTCGKVPCTAWEWEKPTTLWDIIDLSETNILIEDDGTRVLIDIVA